jgi:hypothetical protein
MAIGAAVLLSIGAVPAGSSSGGSFVMVQGKGTFVVTGIDVDVAIVAVKTSSGVVNGHVDHQWAKHDPVVEFGRTVSEVTCVRPSTFTTRVAIGAVTVYSSSGPQFVGEEMLYIVDDLGTGGTGQLDQISVGVGAGASTCPFDPGYVVSPLDDLVSGDYRVRMH